MKPTPLINVSPEDFATVKFILAKLVPTYPVWAFGSRVKGRPRQYSDLDLVILTKSPLNFDIYAALKEAFSESNLPFKVDIVDWSAIDKNFQHIIEQQFVVIQ